MVGGVMEIHDPVEAGAPLLPGQDGWRLHCQSLVGSAPGVGASLWAPTVSDRHCEGGAFSWFSCSLLGTFRGTANSNSQRGGQWLAAA